MHAQKRRLLTGLRPRVIALLASYNEERFIEACLTRLISHGVDVYLIDNGSTDRTVAIAERFRGYGLIDIETIPRHGIYSWLPILKRKEHLANRLDADWFMNLDPDEIRLPPKSGIFLPEAFQQVEQEGYNAVNFQEFTFIPTREEPNHDHPNFVETMKFYYAFGTGHRQVKAWKRPPGPVEFASTGGHQIAFEDIRIYHTNFIMKHYLMLSVEHATRKYIEKVFDPEEIALGWHEQRAKLRADHITLPSSSQLNRFTSDDALDASEPRKNSFHF